MRGLLNMNDSCVCCRRPGPAEDRTGGFDLVYRDGFLRKSDNCLYTSFLGADCKRTPRTNATASSATASSSAEASAASSRRTT